MVEMIITAVIGLAAGVGGTFAYDHRRKARGKTSADQLVADAKSKAGDIVLKAKDEALKLANEA